MSISDWFGRKSALPPINPVDTVFGIPMDTPIGQKMVHDYAQAKTATEINAMMNAQGAQMGSIVNGLDRWNQARTAQAYERIIQAPDRLPSMNFKLREISNGYLVEIGDEEFFIKDLNEVGGVIVTQWAAKTLGEGK